MACAPKNGVRAPLHGACAASLPQSGKSAAENLRWRGVKYFMSVDLRPGESQDSLLKRFRKAVAEARILPIVRQKRWFTSKSEVRRIKRQKAIRKSQRPPRYER
jgi:small subunit ribosomal protein S21